MNNKKPERRELAKQQADRADSLAKELWSEKKRNEGVER